MKNEHDKKDLVRINRVLISVSEKTGVAEFAKKLLKWNVEIISTGGTLKTLQAEGIPAKSVSDITGFPEILDGRVKTLNPKIHGAILAVSDNPIHQKELTDMNIQSIDLIVVNLYPFEKTVAQPNSTFPEVIEQIDIGGPTMLRAAAKNFKFKVAVVNPSRYNSIFEEMEKYNGCISLPTRLELAQEVFQHTARYDALIAKYYAAHSVNKSIMPETFSIVLRKVSELRYGENPHQAAALYGDFYNYFEKIHGKELSFNNIVDIEAAMELVDEFEKPTAAIIKHTNPCGVGSDDQLAEAYNKALATDPKAAFGGVIAFNRTLDYKTANLVNDLFTEVIIAPNFDAEVLEFMRRKKDRRLIRYIKPINEELNIKKIAGGLLVQEFDKEKLNKDQFKVVTNRQPTDAEYDAMLYGWRVVKHLKSNAIVLSTTDRTIGVGAGQMSRVDSTKFAILKSKKAKLETKGTAMASDGFFPFPDSVKEAFKAGVTAVIQPGGSIRDAEVIKIANDKNMTMVFTGIRHFKH